MSESTTFRAPVSAKTSVPLPEGKDPDVPMEKSDIESIALHEELEGKPYSSKHFEVEAIWNESESLEDDLRTIDSYYRYKVQTGELKDDKATFDRFMKEAEKLTNTKDAGTNMKIAKIAEYMRFMEKIDKIEKQARRWQ